MSPQLFYMAKVTSKKKEEPVSKAQQIDSLASDVLSIINKSFKDFPDAGQFLSEANMVTDWISTGCDILDLAISNRPNGGLPCGKVIEFNGLEQCVTEDTKILVRIK